MRSYLFQISVPLLKQKATEYIAVDPRKLVTVQMATYRGSREVAC
jgi:hypothetical protein